MQNSKNYLIFALSVALVALLLTPSMAELAGPDRASLHHEVPDDPYVASPRGGHERSPATRFTRDSFFAVQVNVDALGQNIVGDAANEPSIAVDATDPNSMVIGWRQFDTISSNFRQAGYAYTTDGGLSWTFPGVIDPGIFRSDPVLDSGAVGGLYYNSLTVEGGDNYVCDVYRSFTGGVAWDAGTDARGGDKQWMVIDKSGGAGDGNIYAFWNAYFSSCNGDFTRSTDEGDSFESCSDIPEEPYWGTLAVDSDGRLFTVGAPLWGDDFVVTRSSNAQQAGQSVSWDLSRSLDLGGYIDNGEGPNPGGLLGQAHIATAPGAGANPDPVYVLCSVNPPGSDPLDIRFSRSLDGGDSWSPSIRVNDDTGNNWQWFGTMSASPSGRIDAVWLDTRDNPGTYLSSLYYSFSDDDGLTWSANERLSDAFDPHLGWPNQNKMGDYFHMVSDDLGFSLAWAATFNGEQDVYYARKNVGATAVAESPFQGLALLHADSNPFVGSTKVRYTVPAGGLVTLKLYDILGREVATLASGDRSAGSFEAQLDARNLPAGVYICRLSAGQFHAAKKMLLLK